MNNLIAAFLSGIGLCVLGSLGGSLYRKHLSKHVRKFLGLDLNGPPSYNEYKANKVMNEVNQFFPQLDLQNVFMSLITTCSVCTLRFSFKTSKSVGRAKLKCPTCGTVKTFLWTPKQIIVRDASPTEAQEGGHYDAAN